MVTDVTLQATLFMWLINKWDSETIDAETAFLCALLEEEIYTKIPKVMEEVFKENYMYKDILILVKSIYGLVQAARFWFK